MSDEYGDFLDYGGWGDAGWGGYGISTNWQDPGWQGYNLTDTFSMPEVSQEAIYRANGGWDPMTVQEERELASYMPGGSQYIPPGSGSWTNNNTGASGQIYAPQSYESGMVPNQSGYMSAYDYDVSRGFSPSQNTSYFSPTATPSYSDLQRPSWSSNTSPAPAPAPMPSRGPAQQQPRQLISLGAPERTMYDHYTKNVLDPRGMASDPAYQFLYNQGEQAMNRGLAAKRKQYSGEGMIDQMKFGQGMAFNYMNQMLPQYRGAAQEELARFMGPAGLLPRYAAQNNQTMDNMDQNRAAQDLLPYYQQMLAGGGGGGGGSSMPAIGMGGISGSYNPTKYNSPASGAPPSRLAQAYDPNAYDPYAVEDAAMGADYGY